jgi:TonB family protein
MALASGLYLRLRHRLGFTERPQPLADTPEVARLIDEAREARLRGVVLVEFDTDADGRVTRADACRGPLNQLAWRTAEHIVRAMAFRPAFRRGSSVPYRGARISVQFGPSIEMRRGWIERLFRNRG